MNFLRREKRNNTINRKNFPSPEKKQSLFIIKIGILLGVSFFFWIVNLTFTKGYKMLYIKEQHFFLFPLSTLKNIPFERVGSELKAKSKKENKKLPA